MSSIAERVSTYTARAFYRSWGSPEQAQDASEQSIRAERYARLWDLYQGTAFSNLESWAQYRRAFGLYRQTRLVWDHVHSLVEFYASHVYPGSLASDGLNLPDGIPNAIPLARDTDPELAAAIAQLWTWWNWQEYKNTLVRYTAALGEFLVEIVDETQRGRVLPNFVWPSYIKDIRLNEVGDVLSYVIQYQAWDKDRKEFFTYRREVDKDSFRTYRNDEPFDYSNMEVGSVDGGVPSYSYFEGDGDDIRPRGYEVPNPYGFVPAVWFRHIRTLGVRGEPAVWATQSELDEINSLFSHMLDKSHISLRAPIIVAGAIAPNSLKSALDNMVGAVKRTFTEDLDDEMNDRERLNVLQGPQGTNVSTIELKISEATQALDRIIAGIERKTPEVTFYEQLRSMTQITGAAANRLLGDVDHRLRSIASGYDRQSTKLFQMAVAMAGWRLAEGEDGWANPTEHQLRFANFDLDSYTSGHLDFDIMPRDLVPLTSMERIQIATAKKKLLPQIPDVEIADELGYDRTQFESWQKDYEAEQEKMMQQQMEMAQQELSIKGKPGAPPGGPQRGSQKQNHRPVLGPGGVVKEQGNNRGAQ